ncbi:response regulator transcription factor [Sphingomonas sp. CJ20]
MPHPQPLVLIVDDDGAVRAALRELLDSVGIDAVSYASPGELLAADRQDRPGCLILDVRMPGGSGLELQHRLVTAGDAKPIIFLTGHGDIPMSVDAMKAGAVDFLTKPVRDQTLLDAVSVGIARDCARRAEMRITDRLLERYASLTPRERAVMQLVAQGRLNKQVAHDLSISEVTVKLHRGNVMRKMEVATIGELIRAWREIAAHLPVA